MPIKFIVENVPGKGTVVSTEDDLKDFEFTYNGKVIPRETVRQGMKNFWDLNRDALRAACNRMT